MKKFLLLSFILLQSFLFSELVAQTLPVKELYTANDEEATTKVLTTNGFRFSSVETVEGVKSYVYVRKISDNDSVSYRLSINISLNLTSKVYVFENVGYYINFIKALTEQGFAFKSKSGNEHYGYEEEYANPKGETFRVNRSYKPGLKLFIYSIYLP